MLGCTGLVKYRGDVRHVRMRCKNIVTINRSQNNAKLSLLGKL